MIEYQRSQPQHALELGRQALALWEASGDRQGIGRAHLRVGMALLVGGDVEGGRRELQLARDIAAELHQVEAERQAIINLLKIHADRGDGQAMLALAEEGWNLSSTFARPTSRQILLQAMTYACGLLGQLGRCLTLSDQVLADAAASGEPTARQYAVLTVLDLLVFVGEFERGRALLRELDTLAQEATYYGIKLRLNRAYLEYKAGDAAAARAAIAEVGDPSALKQPQDRVTLALCEAEVLLLEGDAAAALAALEPWRGDVQNVTLLVQIWVVRLRAQLLLGAVNAADWARPRALLDDGQLPPTEALDLRRALWRSAPAGPAARELTRHIDADAARLAASLDGHPRAQAYFLSVYAA